jgi:O-antigen/teichoic acid export membrane protein
MQGSIPVKSRPKRIWKGLISISKQALFTTAGYLVGIEAVNSLVGFLFWGLATQLYSPQDIGLASAIISSVALVSLVASLGTGNGLIRFLPESRQPNRMLNSLFIFNIATAFLVGSLFLVVLPLWSSSFVFLRQNYLLVIGFLAYGVAATFATSLRMAFLALRQARFAFWQSVSVNGARLMFVVVLVGFGIWGLVGSVFLAFTVSIIFSFFIFLPRAFPNYRPLLAFHRPDLSLILPYSFGIYLAFLLVQAPARLLPVIVLEWIGPASAAHAQIAWLVGGVLVTPGAALATSAFVEASNAPSQSSSIFSKASVTGLSVTILGAFFLILVAPWFLLPFGPSYSYEGTTLLRWLSAAAPFVVLVGFYFSYLRFQKRIQRLVVLSGVVAVSTLLFAAIFTSSLGIAAFGIGWFIGYLLVTLIAVRHAMAGNAISEIRQRSHLVLSSLFK